MRSYVHTASSKSRIDPAVDRNKIQIALPSARKIPAARERKLRILSSILSDARRGAFEYIERWKAGRGAE